jgi:succinoglycan biosynthesis protein ExoM
MMGEAAVVVSSPVCAPVVIAVVTYRRNDDLQVLLPLLEVEATTITPRADILVVDNDPEAGASSAVNVPRVAYRHEPVPGIAAARNAALAEAGGYRYLVFIDDDEHPEPGWLRALLGAAAATGAAAVAGAVVSEFDHEPDAWITAGQVFQRRRLPTGTPITVAATNNIVLDIEQIGGLRFEESLGLIGGSDNLFTRTLLRCGKSMVWCDEAVVIDRVPASRLTREWVLRRAYRLSNSEVTVSLMMAAGPRERVAVRLRALGSGAVRILGGALRYLYGVVTRSLAFQARGSRTIRRGTGMVAAAAGSTYAEYLRDVPSRKTWAQRLRIRKK